MALTKETKPYELMFRVHPDGKVGAHVKTRTVYLDDGVEIGAKINPAASIDTPDFPGGDKVKPLVDALLIAQQETITAKDVEIAAEKARADNAEAQVAALPKG